MNETPHSAGRRRHSPQHHAVAASRIEAPDALDDFPTPPWATRALVEHVIAPGPLQTLYLDKFTAWEPACNRGFMARTLAEYFGVVRTSDVADYSSDSSTVLVQDTVRDFLFPDLPPVIEANGVDWIATNPPFRLAQQFFLRAVEIGPREGVALLVRLQWLEGIGRWREIFEPYQKELTVHPFVERVPMVKGRCDGKASTATAYAWIVCWTCEPLPFDPLPSGIRLEHIPPCRAELERPEDYQQGDGI